MFNFWRSRENPANNQEVDLSLIDKVSEQDVQDVLGSGEFIAKLKDFMERGNSFKDPEQRTLAAENAMLVNKAYRQVLANTFDLAELKRSADDVKKMFLECNQGKR